MKDYTDVAHELWALAQLVGDEGISDAVERIKRCLESEFSNESGMKQGDDDGQ